MTAAGPTANAAPLVCAIHQPNFFPWLGYFDKIRRADVFIFLDDVAYPKSGSGMGSWTNRVKIAIQGEARWIGCPLQRFSGARPIRDVRIADGPWREKILRTLDANYRRAAGYARAMAVIEPLLLEKIDLLADFNINAILGLSSALGSGRHRFVRQSELGCDGTGTQLLVDLARSVGAGSYLCGGGASGYQDDLLFESSGIGLIYQNFSPLPYGDPSGFIPGLSAIDFLMRAPVELSRQSA